MKNADLEPYRFGTPEQRQTVKNIEKMREQADWYKLLYDFTAKADHDRFKSYLDAGFTREEAIQVLVAEKSRPPQKQTLGVR